MSSILPDGSDDKTTPASRLIAEVHEMSREELAAAFEEARTSSPARIVERQKRERRERAERAAARGGDA